MAELVRQVEAVMASVEAVPVRIAVAYLIIWSYWAAIRSHRGDLGRGAADQLGVDGKRNF